jgi:hypothetical protein
MRHHNACIRIFYAINLFIGIVWRVDHSGKRMSIKTAWDVACEVWIK